MPWKTSGWRSSLHRRNRRRIWRMADWLIRDSRESNTFTRLPIMTTMWTCQVCGYSSPLPRKDPIYLHIYRCADACCDGPSYINPEYEIPHPNNPVTDKLPVQKDWHKNLPTQSAFLRGGQRNFYQRGEIFSSNRRDLVFGQKSRGFGTEAFTILIWTNPHCPSFWSNSSRWS